jgi:hypothetical protein
LLSWVGPPAGDQLRVPAQQGSRRHEPQPAHRCGKQPGLSALSSARSAQLSFGC